MGARAVPLSTDLDHPEAVPYFLWDEPLTVRELRRRLADGSSAERSRLLAKILREARDPDVWRFTSPQEVVEGWPNWCGTWDDGARSGNTYSVPGRSRGSLTESRLTSLQRVVLEAFFRRERGFFLSGRIAFLIG